jgi:multiple RNA-binding domain-containing protein 1
MQAWLNKSHDQIMTSESDPRYVKHALISQLLAAGCNSVQKNASSGDRSETKVLVRNLAFEATAKDIRGLMEPFGLVKTCRLPKKFDGSTRGFAFVEFATKGDAQKAVRSVHHTHLYGRRLLVEYAQGEAGVDELRAKAAAQINRAPEVKRPRKRQKVVKAVA